MKDTTHKIEWDTLYSPSEIARPSKLNPAGLSLLDLAYSTILRKVKTGEIKSLSMGDGDKYTRFKVRGSILIEYLNREYKTK
jgi:hypothetical protein